MKKHLYFFVVSVMALSLLIPATVSAAETPQQHIITVTGRAETSVAPDLAIATFGVSTSSSNVETAKRDNDRLMQKIFESMLMIGIEHSKIQTSMFSVQPVYRTDSSPASEMVTGYRVQNMIAVTIEDLKKLSQVIDTAFEAGANQFQGIRFGIKKEQTLRDELLKAALLDGKRKAEYIAETLGEKIGRPVSVSESGYVSPVMTDTVRFSKAMPANAAPIAGGLITASVDVHMVFELQ